MDMKKSIKREYLIPATMETRDIGFTPWKNRRSLLEKRRICTSYSSGYHICDSTYDTYYCCPDGDTCVQEYGDWKCDPSGLTTAMKIGISIGSLLVLFLIILASYFCCCRNRGSPSNIVVVSGNQNQQIQPPAVYAMPQPTYVYGSPGPQQSPYTAPPPPGSPPPAPPYQQFPPPPPQGHY